MNEEHDRSESSYRPSSPDLSGFTNAPLPRLNRIPSYHAPDPNLPPGYSFSPRGSYDASPFFSPSTTTTTTPSTSYFGARTQSANPQQPYSPQSFRTPNLPTQSPVPPPPPPLPRAHVPPYHSPTHFHPSHAQHQPRQSFDPAANHYHQQYQQNSQQFATHPPGVAHPYGDMPRTRQSKAAEALDPDYNPNGPPRMVMPTKVEPMQQPLQSIIPIATTDPSHGIDVRTKFPVARIKRIMQADEDVGKVAQATPTAVSKALELFMITLVTKGAAEARANHSKRVTAQHLKAALMKDGQFDFLTEICDNVPDEGSKKGRAKSEAKSEESEEDIAPKKKAKGGRKRKAGSDDDSD